MTATVPDSEQLAYIAAKAADARVNVEFESEGMTLNIGPQHPATHGTLRIVAKLDGEQVVSCEPVPGYMHRGYEKLTEVRTYPQITTLVNRIDWLGSFANEVPFILAAEKLMGVEAPPRAQYIRTILFEMSRLANIVLFLGDLGAQMGGVTAVFYGFRDREFVLNQIEAVTGGRFHPNFDRIGGLKDDLPKGWIAETKAAMEQGPTTSATRSRTLLIGNEIFQMPRPRRRGHPRRHRPVLRPVRRQPARQRRRLGHPPRQLPPRAWPTTRSTGRSGPTPTATASPAAGCASRRSASRSKIVDQLLDTIPAGPIMAKVPRIIKVPEGEAYVETENPLGVMGYYVVSKGDLMPFRVKIRTPSFNNISIVPWVAKGVYVPDVITILASLYFILGDIDR